MSNEEKNKEKETEDQAEDEASKSMIDINVALVMSQRDEALDKLEKALDEIETLRQKLANAEALIEEDSKAALVGKIAPKTRVSKAILSKMTVEDLMKWDRVLDTAAIPVFKAGTPLPYEKKPDARQMLDSKHSDYMKKLRGEK